VSSCDVKPYRSCFDPYRGRLNTLHDEASAFVPHSDASLLALMPPASSNDRVTQRPGFIYSGYDHSSSLISSVAHRVVAYRRLPPVTAASNPVRVPDRGLKKPAALSRNPMPQLSRERLRAKLAADEWPTMLRERLLDQAERGCCYYEPGSYPGILS
jgi:hypothetical protein